MADKRAPSYTDLVYEAFKETRRPLTFAEVFDWVNQRRVITTRDPKATIRSALTQSPQLVNLDDGRYGYLPYLLQGSLLRLPLTEKHPADRRLTYPDEVRQALWPSFQETQKRRVERPVRARLPNGDEIVLALEFFGAGVWGSSLPDGLRRYLLDSRAKAKDSLLLRVVDGEAGVCEIGFEPRSKRDRTAVERRNRELADAAQAIVQRSRSPEVFTWDLGILLLARGLYQAEVAPDPLLTVLRADPRFVDAGMYAWMLAETVTPEMRELIRERRRLEREMLQPRVESLAALAEPAFPLAARASLERTLADVGALLAEQEFASVEEMNEFLQDVLVGGGVPRRTPATPLEQAQELMYQAQGVAWSRERVRLARQALTISPDCADAYVLLAEETARGPKEAAELYAQGVAAGERALGEDAFQEDVGQFWGLIETRPYMRARLGLAHALWALNRRQEAIAHLWDLLRLNPGDNQGVRYLLLNWLLESGDDQIDKLVAQYPDDAAATWLYGRALHAFRTEGDTPRARQLRTDAEKGNPHVPAYLLGRQRLPRRLPEYIGFGDKNEAIVCAADQGAAWRRVPGALAWLEKGLGSGR